VRQNKSHRVFFMSEKLHKVLATIGIGSRRTMEEYISAGRVSVDGKIAKLGDRVEGTEVIRVDGQVIHTATSPKNVCRVLMYNKPEGQMCTRSDPEGRPTVFDRLPVVNNGRWLYIGRLDINTSGLLLFTTDGELANRLMHPSHAVERVYAVRVFGNVTKEQILQLQTGVELEDGMAHFDSVTFVGGEGMNQWYHVVLKEGRKREVRRLWETLGFKVSRLKRIRYANVELDKLPLGGWRELNLAEVNALRSVAGMKPETETFVEDKELSVREQYVKNRQVRRAVRNFNNREQNNARGRASFSRKNDRLGLGPDRDDAFENKMFEAINEADKNSRGRGRSGDFKRRDGSSVNRFAPFNDEKKSRRDKGRDTGTGEKSFSGRFRDEERSGKGSRSGDRDSFRGAGRREAFGKKSDRGFDRKGDRKFASKRRNGER
jgi:23S rRNA pseudouridine2605 synthase